MNQHDKNMLRARIEYLSRQITRQQSRLADMYLDESPTHLDIGKAYKTLWTLQAGIDELIREARSYHESV